MSRWQGYLDTLFSVLKVITFACVLVIIGQIISNDAFNSLYRIDQPIALMFGESFLRIAQFILSYAPLLFMLRLVVIKNKSYNNMILALLGYITFVVFTIYFASGQLDYNAYGSILGISISNSSVNGLANQVNYPLITGLIGPLSIVVVVRFVSNRMRRSSTVGLFGTVDNEFKAYFLTIFFSIIASFIVCLVWPYIYEFIMNIKAFIASDLNNPINLYLYGVMERLSSILFIPSLFKTDFWYNSLGGSVSTIAGQSISGDVNMFTYAINENTALVNAGRLITPYYIINMFAIPAALIAMYRINSDILEKRKSRLIYLLLMAVSLMGGLVLPFEIFLLLLSPVLFIAHLLLFGALFGILNSFSLTLGFVGSNSTVLALPGNIIEFVIYASSYRFFETCIILVAVGVVVALLYYFIVTIYFKKLNTQTFGSAQQPLAKQLVKAFGGVNNLKYVNADLMHVTIQVFDPNEIDIQLLKAAGAQRVLEKRSGYMIFFGGKSFMLKRCIDELINASVRTVK